MIMTFNFNHVLGLMENIIDYQLITTMHHRFNSGEITL